MAGLVDQVTAPLIANIRRRAVAYGLMGLGGLVVIFAAGYALDAVRTLLMFRYGPLWANLIIAGALLVLAAGCVGVAVFIRSRRPRRAGDIGPAMTLAPRPYSAAEMAAAGAATAAAVTATVVVARSRVGRALMARIRQSGLSG